MMMQRIAARRLSTAPSVMMAKSRGGRKRMIKGKGGVKVGKMPAGPPPRDVPLPHTIMAQPEVKTTMGYAKHPDATPSVLEEWYDGKERGEGLKDAERNVAIVAVVSMLLGFVLLKTFFMEEQQKINEGGGADVVVNDENGENGGVGVGVGDGASSSRDADVVNADAGAPVSAEVPAVLLLEECQAGAGAAAAPAKKGWLSSWWG